MASVSTSFGTFATAARAGSMGGTEDWGTESNAQSSNDSRATFTTNLAIGGWSGYTAYLTAVDLTETVPSSATAIGDIVVTVEKRKSANTTAAWVDSAAFLIVGGSVETGDNQATATAYTSSDVSEEYTFDGSAFSVADVNAADFGFAYSAAISGDDSEQHNTAEVDAITVVVNYTPGATATKNAGAWMLLKRC